MRNNEQNFKIMKTVSICDGDVRNSVLDYHIMVNILFILSNNVSLDG